MFETSDPPEIILFLGRFHPLLVHLPIGFLLIAFLLELFSRLPRFEGYRHAVAFVLFLGALSSVLAAGLGYFLSLGGGYDEDLLARHQWMGIGMAGAAIVALFLKTRLSRPTSRLHERVYGLMLTLSVVLMMGTGHYGGSLTHGSDYLTAYLPTSIESFTSGSASKKKQLKVITNLPEAVVYTDIIQPIFDSRCISCHNPAKKKGDLRLNDFAGLMAGGKEGSVVAAGQIAQSELYKRLLLPPENKHAMPPKGKDPLTESELQLIAWWINQGGATADKKVKELPQTPTIKTALATRTEESKWVNPVFAKKINPASPEALHEAERAGFLVLPVAKGQPFLRAQKKIGAPEPNDLSALIPLAEQLVALDLNGTPISDSLLADIGRFKNLTRLRLENTQITDAGIGRLLNLPYLEYLNIYGNPVTDKGILLLVKVPHLRKLYLWQTQVTPAGVAALQQKQQKLQIITGFPVKTSTEPRQPPVALQNN
ncbi:MAG: ribonuclease inhibitor [Adhaeribacter sp.]|nr:ribonuclease inhibitor [Adhaeribacter sp.]